MKTFTFAPILSAIAAAILLAYGSPAFTQDAPEDQPASDKNSVHCLSLNRIRSTEILGDSHILFHMIDKKSYLNILPHACPGMRRNKIIMYRTSMNQLCDLDIITLLDDMGFGFMPGPSCGLGNFRLLDDEEVEDLKASFESRDN